MGFFKNRINIKTIESATSGDPVAINAIVDFYSTYITYLARKKVTDNKGNTYYMVDEYVRRRLETKLITSIVGYEIRQH